MHSPEDERAAHDGDSDEDDVSEVHDGGHQDVAVAVGFVRVTIELVVDLFEVLLGSLLVTEHLDDLLSVDHLLDETFRLAHGILLAHEVFRALGADELGDEHHDRDAREHHQREIDAGDEHGHEQGEDADQREQPLRHALRDELSQRVDVVGVVAHDVAVGVGVEIFDGQGLHLVEHVLADVFQKALRDDSHEAGVGEGAQYAERIDARHDARDGVEGVCDVVEAVFQPRGDDVVNEQLEEDGGADARDSGHGDADDDEQELPLIVAPHIPEQSAEDLHRAAFADLDAVSHARSPPFPSNAVPLAPPSVLARSAAEAPILFCE